MVKQNFGSPKVKRSVIIGVAQSLKTSCNNFLVLSPPPEMINLLVLAKNPLKKELELFP